MITITNPEDGYKFVEDEKVAFSGQFGPVEKYEVFQYVNLQKTLIDSETFDLPNNPVPKPWTLTLNPRPEPGHYAITVLDAMDRSASRDFHIS